MYFTLGNNHILSILAKAYLFDKDYALKDWLRPIPQPWAINRNYYF